MKVRFSFLMPVYNREKYVRQTIDSVLSQTFTDFELIAIDDGSTDGSLAVLKSYGNRIRVIEQRNQGPEVARNTAAALAKGEYLALFDSDDLLFPSALAVYDQLIRTFDSPPLIMGSAYFFQDGQGMPDEERVSGQVEVSKFQDYISKSILLPGCASIIVIKKSVYDEVGGMRNSTPLTWHNDDINLLLKVGTYGPCIVVQRPYTVAYRLHAENSIKNLKLIAEGILTVARSERLGEYPGENSRRRDRYAILGGRAATWALRYCWRAGQRKLALRLLLGTAPMVAAAVWKKFLRRFQKPAAVIALPEEQPQTISEANPSASKT
jgi:glycosyltransferase involved in cell wall biosynthesis